MFGHNAYWHCTSCFLLTSDLSVVSCVKGKQYSGRCENRMTMNKDKKKKEWCQILCRHKGDFCKQILEYEWLSSSHNFIYSHEICSSYREQINSLLDIHLEPLLLFTIISMLHLDTTSPSTSNESPQLGVCCSGFTFPWSQNWSPGVEHTKKTQGNLKSIFENWKGLHRTCRG